MKKLWFFLPRIHHFCQFQLYRNPKLWTMLKNSIIGDFRFVARHTDVQLYDMIIGWNPIKFQGYLLFSVSSFTTQDPFHTGSLEKQSRKGILSGYYGVLRFLLLRVLFCVLLSDIQPEVSFITLAKFTTAKHG